MAKQPNNNPNNMPGGKKPKSSRILYIIYGAIMVALLFGMFDGGTTKTPIKWERLEKILERGDYETITVVNQSVAEIKIKEEAVKTNAEYGDLKGKKGLLGSEAPVGVYTYNVGTLEHFDHQLSEFKEIHDGKIVSYENETQSSALKDILVFFGPLLIFILFIWFMGFWGRKKMGGDSGGGFGGFFGFGRSTAKQYDATKQVNVTFKDVAGLAGAKEEVMEVVDFL